MYIDPETDKHSFSPSDLTAYVACHYLFTQRVANARREREWPNGDDAMSEKIQQLGDDHERQYLERLKASGLVVAEIPEPRDGSRAESIALTAEAIADPNVDVVFQASLAKDDWFGKADFLEREDIKHHASGTITVERQDPRPPFEAVDTKLARSVKPAYVLQLCFYSDALADVQSVGPPRMHVELGNGIRESFRVAEFIHYFRAARDRLEQFAKSGEHSAEYPWPTGHCDICELKTECENRRHEDNHASLIASAQRAQIEKLVPASEGLVTVTEVAELGDDARPARMGSTTFNKLRNQAKLQETTPPTWTFLEPQFGRGFAQLPPVNAGDLFWDIEGNPFFDDGNGLEYLHGVTFLEPDGSENFTALWAHTREEERASFESLIDLFYARWAEFPDMHIYHYAHYEKTRLEQLAQRHGVCEEAVDELLRRQVLVDLYRVTRQALQASVESYSIKKIEKFYLPERQAELRSGDDSIVLYEKFTETGDDSIRQLIEDYNREDVTSTWMLRDWLLARRDEAVAQFGEADMLWIPPAESGPPPTDEIPDDQLTPSQLATRQRHQDLLATGIALQLEADQADDPQRRSTLECAANLMQYHQREAKPKWWELFSRQAMTVDELVDDTRALSRLTLAADQPDADKVRRFNFEPQEYKLRVDDSVQDLVYGYGTGTIVAIDDEAGTIDIKASGKAADYPPPEAIFELSYFSTKVHEEALLDFGRSLLEQSEDQQPPRFPAIRKMIFRELPLAGERVQRSNLSEIRDLLADLEVMGGGSYLTVQGPPGSGKTYTAAKLIVDLLIKGKRVGVSATTHKAINGVLKEVERHAHERGHSFRGVKKASSSAGNEYVSDHGLIESVTKNDGDILRSDLVAGTSWLFARPEWRGQLDYIFIDEAGQMALADTIAISTATKNIVMLGDPAQLSQVVQGTHPGDSGSSALAYILGEARTIPEDMGVFLEHTRRMRPEICAFISDMFYDGRLLPDPMTSDFSTPAGVGLKYFAVDHAGCGQWSQQEADAIASEISALKLAGVPLDKIIVVAPYNAQVDLLRRTLPAGLKGIGTVDKFQGQEASVVFYSMAASGGSEVPRGLDFLFSANRFNVAVSRAEALVYLVANPELVSVECGSVRDMRLANSVAAFVALADQQDG